MTQTATDLSVLRSALNATAGNRGAVKFLEIGVFAGSTAKYVKEHCDFLKVPLDYWGIDDASHPNFKDGMRLEVPVAGASIVIGKSSEVFFRLPDDFDVILVDGDHGGNAVILDTLLYGQKVRPGGFMLFHDTAPGIQQTMREQHGPDHPWFYNSVLAAHKLMSFPCPPWVLEIDEYDESASFGGMRAYRKVE